MKMRAFRDIVPCSFVEGDQCFRGTYCFHYQGDETSVFFNDVIFHVLTAARMKAESLMGYIAV
jgi:hypothetical protein